MYSKYLSILMAVLLSGCASLNNEVGGLMFPNIDGQDYDYVGFDDLTRLDLYKLQDGKEYLYDHRAILVTVSSGRYEDAREIVKVLNAIEFDDLIEKREAIKAAEDAERRKIAEALELERLRQEEIRVAERRRQQEIRVAERRRQEEIRVAERERQQKIRKANAARVAELRRQKIMNMQPVLCDNMISALNANEVRAIRQYPLDQEYRVIGIAEDVNVTFGDAIVVIKSDVDILNGCSAKMSSFDDAEVINIGDTRDLFCSSWTEFSGSVIFKKCRPYRSVI
jgi:hypothetical protein